MVIHQKDMIIVVDHDPKWPSQFAEESGKLRRAFGHEAVRLEHIGSTAVPGLCAKPVIDIMASVHQLYPADHYSCILNEMGYQNVPHDNDAERLFWTKGMPRTHHLHIVHHRAWSYWKHIIFRDFLRSHPEEIERYGDLKRESAKRFRDDRQAYVGSKEKMIEEMTLAAVIEKLVIIKE